MEILQTLHIIYPTPGLKCNGCNITEDYFSDGYQCLRCNIFIHKECAESPLRITNFYHPKHSLDLKMIAEDEAIHGECNICRGKLPYMYYHCSRCNFFIDLICAKKEVILTINTPKIHEHKLTLAPNFIKFTCHLCKLQDDRFPYTCNICDLKFHKDCAESSPEINYSGHPKHSLKIMTYIPNHTEGKCSWCRNKLTNVFYHCSICDFNVDLNCAKNPPSFTILNHKVHEHELTLMPGRYFECNACGKGDDDDRNPYVCLQCNFMIHKKCIDMPRVIKINRHDHSIHYKHFLDAGDWKCGVCHQKIKGMYSAYSCPICSGFVVHLRCATKIGVWDRIELEGISENMIEVKSPFEIVEEGTIKHHCHENHVLKFNEVVDDNIICDACASPVLSSPYYRCTECDDFILHEKCANLPIEKQDSIFKVLVIMVPRRPNNDLYLCYCCQYYFHGFRYESKGNNTVLDVRCGSISEPFNHESHRHPLYIDRSRERYCQSCGESGDKATTVLSCGECEFALDIKCAILPKMVKHKYDKDHYLYLTYAQNYTSMKYWCEICEEEVNPKLWFYSCDSCGFTSHIKCTLGDFPWTKPKISYAANPCQFINNRLTRPICDACGNRCRFPYVLRFDYFTFEKIFCSVQCYWNKNEDFKEGKF